MLVVPPRVGGRTVAVAVAPLLVAGLQLLLLLLLLLFPSLQQLSLHPRVLDLRRDHVLLRHAARAIVAAVAAVRVDVFASSGGGGVPAVGRLVVHRVTTTTTTSILTCAWAQ